MALPHTDPTDLTDLTGFSFVGGKSHGGSHGSHGFHGFFCGWEISRRLAAGLLQRLTQIQQIQQKLFGGFGG